MDIAKVTSKGQVTIPKSVRDDLELQPGSKVLFIKSGESWRVISTEQKIKPSASSSEQSDLIKQRFLAEAAAKYDLDLDEVQSVATEKTSAQLLNEIRAGFRAVMDEQGLTSDQEIATFFGISEDDSLK